MPCDQTIRLVIIIITIIFIYLKAFLFTTFFYKKKSLHVAVYLRNQTDSVDVSSFVSRQRTRFVSKEKSNFQTWNS